MRDILVIFVMGLLIVLSVWGYAANIYKASQLDFASPYKAEAFRAVGIFVPPAGVILGYIDIKD